MRKSYFPLHTTERTLSGDREDLGPRPSVSISSRTETLQRCPSEPVAGESINTTRFT